MQDVHINALTLTQPRHERPDLLCLRAVERQASAPWACFWTGNLLAPEGVAQARDAARCAAAAGAHRLICFSGSLGSDLDAPTPANWLGLGMDALRAALAQLQPRLRELGVSLLIQPHARHVVSDAPSTLIMLSRAPTAPAQLALNPALLLEPSMLSDAADHLERALSALLPRAECLLLTNVEPACAGSDAALAPAPITAGAIPVANLLAIVRAAVSSLERPLPVALLARDLAAQLVALHAAGYTVD